MECLILKRLVKKQELAQQQVLHFHPNSGTHMLKPAKAIKYVERFQQEVRDTAEEIGFHERICDVCIANAGGV